MTMLIKLERASIRYSRDNGTHNLYYVQYQPKEVPPFWQVVAVPSAEVVNFEQAMSSGENKKLGKKDHKVLDGGKGTWDEEKITKYDMGINITGTVAGKGA